MTIARTAMGASARHSAAWPRRGAPDQQHIGDTPRCWQAERYGIGRTKNIAGSAWADDRRDDVIIEHLGCAAGVALLRCWWRPEKPASGSVARPDPLCWRGRYRMASKQPKSAPSTGNVRVAHHQCSGPGSSAVAGPFVFGGGGQGSGVKLAVNTEPKRLAEPLVPRLSQTRL